MPLKLILTPSNLWKACVFRLAPDVFQKVLTPRGKMIALSFFIPQNKIDVNNYFLKEQVKLIIYLFFEVYDNVYYHFKFKKNLLHYNINFVNLFLRQVFCPEVSQPLKIHPVYRMKICIFPTSVGR